MSLPISLTDLADYARAMRDDPDTGPADRHVWADIAAEVEDYLTPSDDASLFDTAPPTEGAL